MAVRGTRSSLVRFGLDLARARRPGDRRRGRALERRAIESWPTQRRRAGVQPPLPAPTAAHDTVIRRVWRQVRGVAEMNGQWSPHARPKEGYVPGDFLSTERCCPCTAKLSLGRPLVPSARLCPQLAARSGGAPQTAAFGSGLVHNTYRTTVSCDRPSEPGYRRYAGPAISALVMFNLNIELGAGAL